MFKRRILSILTIGLLVFSLQAVAGSLSGQSYAVTLGNGTSDCYHFTASGAFHSDLRGSGTENWTEIKKGKKVYYSFSGLSGNGVAWGGGGLIQKNKRLRFGSEVDETGVSGTVTGIRDDECGMYDEGEEGAEKTKGVGLPGM